MVLQECCHSKGIVRNLLHSEGQSLHAHVDEERIEGTGAHPHVTQTEDTGSDRKRHPRLPLRSHHLSHWSILSESFVHPRAMVRVARLAQDRKLATFAPIEVTFLNNKASHRITMASEALGG